MTPEKAQRQVREAWQLGVLIVAVTMVISVSALFSEATAKYFSSLNSFGSYLVLLAYAVLTIGTYHRSANAAGALFALFAASKIYELTVMGAASMLSIVVPIIFSFFLFRGWRAAVFLKRSGSTE